MLVILVALAAIVVPLVSNATQDASEMATKTTMKALRDAVQAYYQDMKGVAVVKKTTDVTGPKGVAANSTGMPNSLADLQNPPLDALGHAIAFDPVTRRGWRGPYLMQATGKFDLANLDASFVGYGNQDDPAFLDGWKNPIVLQWPNTTDGLDVQTKYVRLVSAGAPAKTVNGKSISVINTLATVLMPTIPTISNTSAADQRGNDLVLFILSQDQYP